MVKVITDWGNAEYAKATRVEWDSDGFLSVHNSYDFIAIHAPGKWTSAQVIEDEQA